MATQSVKLQELDKRLRKVERQIAAFTRDTQRKPKSPARKKKTGERTGRSAQRDQAKAATALDIVRRAGLLAELPLKARSRVERWRAMPEDEREHILDEFFNLQLDRPLSDIIIENRQ